MTLGGDSVPGTDLRIALCSADGDALAAMRPWLLDALADGGAAFDLGPSGDSQSWLARPSDGSTVRVVMLTGEPAGYVTFRRDGAVAVVTALVIAPQHRNRGYGAEAVFAVERLCTGISACRGLVPLRNGLAVYFWLRVGYRPLFASRHGRAGVTVTERSL